MTIGSHDVLAAFAYHIIIDQDIELAQFQKVDGISVEVQPIEYRAMTTKGSILRKAPGLKKYGDITLSRGKVKDKQFWEWIEKAQKGDLVGARKTGSIVLVDYTLTAPVQTFKFKNAWPTKVALGGLAAGSNEALIETITLCVEELTIG